MSIYESWDRKDIARWARLASFISSEPRTPGLEPSHWVNTWLRKCIEMLTYTKDKIKNVFLLKWYKHFDVCLYTSVFSLIFEANVTWKVEIWVSKRLCNPLIHEF